MSKNNQQKTIPKNWQVRSLNEVLKIGSGKDYKHLKFGNVPVFGTGGYMLSVDKILGSGETVFIGRKGTINKPFYYNGDFWTVDTLFYTYNYKNTNAKFINLVFKKINWKKYNEASGVPSLSKATIEKIKFIFPPLPEQNAIVRILEVWDKYLEKLDKKIEVKKNIKKGLMQKLLSGQKRLKGFSGEWSKLKLGDAGEIITGNTPPMKDKDNYGEKYCWATAEDFNGKYIKDTNIKLSDKGRILSRFLPVGSVLITCIASIGKNAIADVPLATNQQINSIVVNRDNSNEFFYYTLQNSNNLLKRYAGVGAMPILNKLTFSKIKLKIPELSEQTAIANILTTADEEIETLEKKKKNIKDQKKYLLNNLISGKIRIPEFVK